MSKSAGPIIPDLESKKEGAASHFDSKRPLEASDFGEEDSRRKTMMRLGREISLKTYFVEYDVKAKIRRQWFLRYRDA